MSAPIPTLILVAALVLLPACADVPMGSSVQMAVNSQKLNPVTPPPYPVVGLDGQKAARDVEQYRLGPKENQSVVSTSIVDAGTGQ